MAIVNLRHINVARTADPVLQRVRPRGLPPALEAHEVFRTNVISDAERMGTELFGRHRIRVAGTDAAEFMASFHAVRLREITFGYLDYHVDIQLSSDRLPHDHYVLMPTNGSGHVETTAASIATSTIRACCLPPEEPVAIQWTDDAPQLVVSITQDAVRRYLATLIGRSADEPVRFELGMDLATPVASRWHAALQVIHAEIADPHTLAGRGLGVGPLEEFLVTTLLLTQPSNYSNLLAATPQSPGHRAVRLAVEYLQHHLGEPISVAELAAHVGVSVRSLQKGFQDAFGVTPSEYVRDRRLERVHDALRDATPADGLSVTELAYRWGFTHPGRFASAYRRRYGEAPSTTLRS